MKERHASVFHAELAALVGSKHAVEAGARKQVAELMRSGADLESKLRIVRVLTLTCDSNTRHPTEPYVL